MDLALVVMAAGFGSRYGGLKQVERVGPQGAALMEFSIFDAIRSGFNRLIVVVNPQNEELVREQLSSILALEERKISVDFVQQRLDDLPEGCPLPPARQKPWGTGQAVWAIRKVVQSPFVVINADDFYGLEAFQKMAEFFRNQRDRSDTCALVSYELENTLSSFGSVSRALCTVNKNGQLIAIEEHTKITAEEGGIFSYFNGEKRLLEANQPVSVNFWGFSPTLFQWMSEMFKEFLKKNITSETAEFYLPSIARSLIEKMQTTFNVLTSKSRWFGITYREDKPLIEQAILSLTQKKSYPQKLF